MKKLHSLVFYALITPAMTLGAGSVLAQQATDNHAHEEVDRKGMYDKSRKQNRGYIAAVPAHGSQASNLIGTDVRTRNNEDIGSVDDLIIDGDGQVVAIIVSVGGFLGIGQKDVAIGWDNVTKIGDSDNLELRIDASRDDLKNAPVFAKRD